MSKALIEAARQGNFNQVETIVDFGADVMGVDVDYNTALHWAAWNGHATIVEYLVDNGADVNASNWNGDTALRMAAENGHTKIVEHLVRKGVDVRTLNKNGDTALHWAAYKGFAPIIEFLVRNGADVSAVNKSGDTALTLASSRGKTAVVRILETAAQRSAPANVSDRRSAILALINENDGLRTRLGIKTGLEVKEEFDVDRLIEMAVKKRETTDPTLRADFEAEIDFHVEASTMLTDDNDVGNPMRPWRR